ncbi:MAG: polyphosphate kinase 1 [Chitinophagaceae bacterium]
MKKESSLIPRDISWLSFNARVLQEANDPNVPLIQRIHFLGIFSNNMDEFFRVRVAALRRMVELKGKKVNFHFEVNPQKILDEINQIVLHQQNEFDRIWNIVQKSMAKENVFLVDDTHLTGKQQAFVRQYFEKEVESSIIPLLVENIPTFPYLREKSLFLGVVMSRSDAAYSQKFAVIEVPSRIVGRFKELPTDDPNVHQIILLEDVIKYNLPHIFSYFGFDRFDTHVFKVTKDAEFDIDNDISTTLVQKIEKGLKNRRKGKTVRFVYDKAMNPILLEYLLNRLDISRKDVLIPGGTIHNFRHFMDFPDVFAPSDKSIVQPSFIHPRFKGKLRVTDVVLKEDVLLSFPYHSFVSVIDLLREAAMDPDVQSIKITAYRLAPNSKIVNALINAIRNGKQVTVMLELRARFDEEANLAWKQVLELEGVKVLLGVPNMKVHGKVCVIKKRIHNKTIQYGFVSTGNLNEKTARFYCDECLMTANRNVMADINRIFRYLEDPKLLNRKYLAACKTLLVCPTNMRDVFISLIDKEIKAAKAKKKAKITVKANSLSDEILIDKLYEAAYAGVEIQLIVRGIFCAESENKKFKAPMRAISIVDQYLEHARILIFHNGGNEKIYISSADWMVRNLDHRVEVAVPILKEKLKKEIKEIISIQLQDNIKARILDNELSNRYVPLVKGAAPVRSQVEIYNFLAKTNN